MIKNTGAFVGKTVFVTGASRGIGKAIALKIAQDGANIVIAAKTTDPHPKLEGTIFTAAKEIENAGGKCLPVQCDLRDEETVKNAFDKALQKFGALDILINNASAISLTSTEDTTMKKYDLMHQINTRGTFMASKYAIPHLKKSSNPHILNLSPPLEMKNYWFSKHVAYTMAKYGMSMCVLGMAEELKAHKIAVNALWPRTAIWTAAMSMLGGGSEEMANMCRNTDIISDSAYAILSKSSTKFTGNFLIDEEFLRTEGVTNFDSYSVKPGNNLLGDFFIPEKLMKGLISDLGNDKAASEANPSESSVLQILEKSKSVITDSVKKEINSTLLFCISGKNYLFDAHSQRPLRVEQVQEPPKADVILTTDEETFVKMSKGEINSTSAFMSGKLKIKGNLSVAMKAESIFKAMKNK